MTIPITSDLAGYADFWTREIRVLCVVGATIGGLLLVQTVFLILVWQAVRR